MKPIEQMPDPASKIELSKALKALRDVVAPEQFKQVVSLVSPDDVTAIDNAIAGLSEEDEFALLCRLMESATHISPIEQRPIIHNDAIAPDFLARFHLGPPASISAGAAEAMVRCFVEVKSTTEDKFKIGGSNLRKRRAFADAFGLPLLIAVRFLRAQRHALWAIVHDADRTATSLTITTADIVKGPRPILWHEFSYMLRPRIRFEAVYDPSSSTPGVIHTEFGTQREFRLVGDHSTLRLTAESAFFASMMFEAFDLEEVSIERQDGTFVQTLAPKSQMLLLAEIVFRMNRQLREESGELIVEAPKMLARVDTDVTKYLITRTTVEAIMSPLILREFVFLGTLGDPGEQAAIRGLLLWATT